jgi:RNA polymerase sigma factor (sigma-70 family)
MNTIKINELFKEYKEGSKAAKDKLVLAFTPICKKIALRYKGLNLDTFELQQEGVLGIYAALERYSDAYDCSLETYVTRRIFTVVDEFVLLNIHTHHIPLHTLKSMRAAKNRIDNDLDERHFDNKVDSKVFVQDTIRIAEGNQLESGPFATEDTISKECEFSLEDTRYMEQLKEMLTCTGEGGSMAISVYLREKSVTTIAESLLITPYKVQAKINESLDIMRRELAC